MVTKAQNGEYCMASTTFPDHINIFFFFICKLTQTRETYQILFIFITPGWQVKYQVRFHSEAIGEPYAILLSVFLSYRNLAK